MLDDLKYLLESKGITPSFHRIKIFEYLINTKAHPTAEKIYSEMLLQIPTLSKTTIYNTLKTLLKKGLVSSITIEDNEVRFDADMKFHGHFKCIQCGMLYDIILGSPLYDCIAELEKERINGHKIIESQLYFKGICKNCVQ